MQTVSGVNALERIDSAAALPQRMRKERELAPGAINVYDLQATTPHLLGVDG